MPLLIEFTVDREMQVLVEGRMVGSINDRKRCLLNGIHVVQFREHASTVHEVYDRLRYKNRFRTAAAEEDSIQIAQVSRIEISWADRRPADCRDRK